MRLPLVRVAVDDGASLMDRYPLIYVIWPGTFPDFPDRFIVIGKFFRGAGKVVVWPQPAPMWA